MAYKNQNYMTNIELKEQADKAQKDYVAPQEEQQKKVITKKQYSFTSYADDQGNVQWGEGTVEITGVESNGYTQVKVLTNTPETSFIDQEFYIISSAKPGNTLYELYSDAGTTATGIFVSISEIQGE